MLRQQTQSHKQLICFDYHHFQVCMRFSRIGSIDLPVSERMLAVIISQTSFKTHLIFDFDCKQLFACHPDIEECN